jgi:hypothetical protein
MKPKALLFSLLFALFVTSCKHEPQTVLDDSLFSESTDSELLDYKNGKELSPTGSSPHGNFTLKLNAIANAVLDQNGKVPAGKTFPNGSLIVKQVIKNNNIDLYAIMKKDSSSSVAGENWLWAEYERNGNVYYSVSRKGGSCIGCHSTGTNSDLTKVFDLQ